MRVGFGCTVLARGLSGSGIDGIGSYTQELGYCLKTSGDVYLSPVCFSTYEKNVLFDQSILTLPPFKPSLLTSLLTPFNFPEKMLKDLDLFHSPDHLIPKYRHIPVVATLMDAIPLSHPEWVRMKYASVKGMLWKKSAQWADHVITISEFSKQEIVHYFGVHPDRISVIPLGVDSRFFIRFSSDEIKSVTQRLGLPDTFFLFVGTLQPRKNLTRLLDAHASLSKSLQQDVPLVIVGREGWGADEIVTKLGDESLKGKVHWLQYIPDVDVRALLQAAQALVFPSLCEGFGLPVVEAYASGLPVITSNVSSLPEVAGDAALLVDPTNIDMIADAMRKIIEDPDLAQEMSRSGLARARTFDWSTCAERTKQIYQQVLSGK